VPLRIGDWPFSSAGGVIDLNAWHRLGGRVILVLGIVLLERLIDIRQRPRAPIALVFSGSRKSERHIC